MTLPFQATRQVNAEPGSDTPTIMITAPEPGSWMPLEGLAQTWAAFAGAFLTPPAFMAVSMAFGALSLEAGALTRDRETCCYRSQGEIAAARAACTQAVQDLQVVSSQWERALYWLERLAGDGQGDFHSTEAQAVFIRTLFGETTAQLHRLNALTFQVQQGGIVYSQRTSVLGEEEGNDRAASGHTTATTEAKEERRSERHATL